MPKDASYRSARKSRTPHYHPYSPPPISQESSSKESDETTLKEWEDATCPICMEFPHNAVLLVCTSHDNGCRPYMCDTSYRHSNCLDQYKKLASRGGGQCSSRGDDVIHGPPSTGGSSSARTRERSAVRMRPLRELLLIDNNENTNNSNNSSSNSNGRISGGGGGDSESNTGPGRAVRGFPGVGVEESESSEVQGSELQLEDQPEATPATPTTESRSDSLDLMCPLCRGKVVGWKVVEQARRHLNCKSRNCAQESCGFTGSYNELRKHARCVHPFARPSDVDPARQRDWRHLERERDIGDVLSTIQSAMPGARILGDYVIDEDNDEQEDEGDDADFPGDDGNWWTVFLLVQLFGPVAANAYPGTLSSRVVAAAAAAPPREGLWGEEIQINRAASHGGDGGAHGGGTLLEGGAITNSNSTITVAAREDGGGGEVVGSSTTRRRRSRHHHHRHHQPQQQQ